jgi:hypothetical protein
MIPRSSTLPKSSRSDTKALENIPAPIEFLVTLFLSASNVKSNSYGPKSRVMPFDLIIKVQLPFSKGNSKVNFLVKPGPIEEIPSSDSTFLLSLVWIKISSPPTGIEASFDISTDARTTSWSSSSISIFDSNRRHSRGATR